MTHIFFDFLLVISKLVKIQSFITIIIFLIALGICYRKIRKLVFCVYLLYLGVFFVFFTVNDYGTDIFTILFFKNNMTPNSFYQLKKDIASKKKLEEKIILSYSLSKEIKHRVKKFEEEINSAEKEFNNIKGIERKFIPWVDTADKV